MKHIFKIYFTISLIIVLFFLGSIWFFSQESNNDNLQELRRYTVANFEEEFNRQKSDAFKIALALSEDDSFRKLFEKKNYKKAYQHLYNISKKFSVTAGMKKLRLQLITNELEIFAENWKNDKKGQNLKNIRKDLEGLTKAKVSIETGRLLTFKATIPIKSDNKNIGYLEVIQPIDEFSAKLRKQGIELFALMNKEHVKEDSLMFGFPHLNNYVIANEDYDARLKQKAEAFSWKRLEHLGYYEHNGRLFILKDMLNGKKENIGKYLMILRKNMFTAYKDSYQDTSIITRFSDRDIYNYVKKDEKLLGIYSNNEYEELLKILPDLSKEDQHFVKESSKGILQEYSKDELIDIILETNYKEEKRGIIK